MAQDDGRGELPQRIGRYRILAVLGRGAMGVVYKGHDDSIDRAVAIKTILPALVAGDVAGEWLDRFRREARAAGRCQHRSIVSIYELGEHDGAPFLAMEFVDGRTLERSLRDQGPLAPARAVPLLAQVLDALGFAHAQGVVHRDIKPANIMLVEGQTVKVTDFGVARLDSVAVTREGMMVGTPSYMAPEQFEGGTIDHRTDLFSAAVVLFEMLTGRRPFTGSTMSEIMYQAAHGERPLASRVNPALGAGFDPILAKALARDPAARFQSAGAFARALEGRDAAPGPGEATMVAPAPPPADATVVSGARPAPASAGSAAVPPAAVERVTKALASAVGPIARVHVRAALAGAGSLDALVKALEPHLDSEAERTEFRRRARSD